MRLMNGRPLAYHLDFSGEPDPICSEVKRACDDFLRRRDLLDTKAVSDQKWYRRGTGKVATK